MVVVGKAEVSKALGEIKKFRKLMIDNKIPSNQVTLAHAKRFFEPSYTVEKIEHPTDSDGGVMYIRLLIMNKKRTFAVRAYIGGLNVLQNNHIHMDKYFDLTVIPRENQQLTGAGKTYLEKTGFEHLGNHYHKQIYPHHHISLGLVE